MRVFVTGASGFVGSAVVQNLLKAGHKVVGLARSEASAAAIKKAGAEVLHGDITDLASLRKGAQETDATIHTAFIHDFSKWAENCGVDERAINAMGEALEGTDKTLIVTSGTGLIKPGQVATEKDQQPPPAAGHVPRVSEQTAQAFNKRGVKAMSIRLSPSVHGAGDHGFVPILIGMARQAGYAAYIGDGENVWSGVHRLDAGSLYRLALEKGHAGANYHGVGEMRVPFKEIAEAIGRGLKASVKSLNKGEAAQYFTWFMTFAAGNIPASSEITRKELGWNPSHPGLIHDIDHTDYFKAK